MLNERFRSGYTAVMFVRGASVYDVCMARLNVYVPDDLAERARRAGLNISALAQAAILAELDHHATAALAITRHLGEAELLFQETLVHATRQLRAAPSHKPFLPWLVKLARPLDAAKMGGRPRRP